MPLFGPAVPAQFGVERPQRLRDRLTDRVIRKDNRRGIDVGQQSATDVELHDAVVCECDDTGAVRTGDQNRIEGPFQQVDTTRKRPREYIVS